MPAAAGNLALAADVEQLADPGNPEFGFGGEATAAQALEQQTGMPPMPPAPPEAGGLPPGRPDPDAPITQPILTKGVHQEVVRAAEEVMTAAGIPWNRTKFPVLSDQIVYHVNNLDIPLTTLQGALEARGMSVTEFMNGLWRTETVKHSAQTLNSLQQMSRRLLQITEAEKAGGREAGKAAAVREDAARGFGHDIAAAGLLRGTFQVWRKLIISQPSTLAHVLTSDAARLLVSGLTDSVDVALNRAARAMGFKVKPAARPMESLHIAMTSLAGLGTFGGKGTDVPVLGRAAEHFKERAALVDQVLDVANPKFMDQMYLATANELGKQAKDGMAKLAPADRVLVGLDRIADKALTLHRGYQNISFKATLSALLEGEVGKVGRNLASVMDEHVRLVKQMQAEHGPAWAQYPALYSQFLEDPRNMAHLITEETMQRVTDKTLELHLQEAPAYGSAWADAIRLINKVPVWTGIPVAIPFPRFMYNSLKFLYEHSPAGPFSMLKKADWSKIIKEKDATSIDFNALGKAAVGSALFLTAWQMRNSKDAGEKWDEINTPDGVRTIKASAYNPFASYLFIADILKRKKDNTLHKLTGQDILQGLLSTNLRGGAGLAMLDEFSRSVTSIGSADDVTRSLARVGGEFAGGFFTPLQAAADLFAQFDADSRTVRNRRIEPFLGPIKQRIPGLNKTLPELEVPTRRDAPVQEFPALKQLFGLSISAPKNILERELDRMQFTPNEILTREKNPEADALVRHFMGDYAETVILPVVASEGYQRMGDGEKGELLREFLGAARREARGMAMAERPDLFDPLRHVPFRKRLMLEQLQQDAEAGGPPPRPQDPEEDAEMSQP